MEMEIYEVRLLLGRLCIRLASDVPLIVTEEIRAFCTDTVKENITAHVAVMPEKITLPNQMAGEDLLLEYYCEKGYFMAAAKKGTKGSAAVTV